MCSNTVRGHTMRYYLIWELGSQKSAWIEVLRSVSVLELEFCYLRVCGRYLFWQWNNASVGIFLSLKVHLPREPCPRFMSFILWCLFVCLFVFFEIVILSMAANTEAKKWLWSYSLSSDVRVYQTSNCSVGRVSWLKHVDKMLFSA